MNLIRLDYSHIIGIRQDIPVPQTPYTGAGDIVSGALSWWGLRAYNNASIGTNCCRIRRNSDNAEQDFVTLPTGKVDQASISSFLTATTGAIVTMYDQGSSARAATMATAAAQPVVNLSGIGSLVTADFSSASSHRWMTSGGLTQGQPLTISAAVKSINTGVQQSLHLDGGSGTQLGFRNSADNQVFLYAGSVVPATATDSVFHSIQGVSNGASSDVNVDGASTGGNPGVQAISGTTQIGIINGQFLELGIWAGAFSGTQSTNMDANQSTFWGY